MAWFSARLRFAVLVDPEGATTYSDSLCIFQIERSEDDVDTWGQAFQRALQLGYQREEEYLNPENHRVRWRLKEVSTLDLIQSESLDGAEVYAEFTPLGEDEELPFDTHFDPGKSAPTQTGI